MIVIIGRLWSRIVDSWRRCAWNLFVSGEVYEGAQQLPLSNLVAGCLLPPLLPLLLVEGGEVGGGDNLKLAFPFILMADLCLDCRFRDF